MSPPALRIVFAGTPEFSVPALDALHAAGHAIVAVYTQPDRPAGRGRAVASSAVKQRAITLGLPVEQPASLRTETARAQIEALAPDLMVVVAYGLILPQAVLDVPRLGCLNIHASLLPRWRGAAPIQRAVLAGDARTGVTIMQMDAGLDTGPELLRREVAIRPHETAGELHDRLAPLGAQAIVEAVALWAGGQLRPQPQPAEGATYAARISKEEARIDWSQPAAAIERQVLAFNPWPVAETTLDGERIRIWKGNRGHSPVSETGNRRMSPVSPGTVLDVPGRIVVATGEGVLELLQLQWPGRRPLPARDVLNSRSLAGARFGTVAA